MYLMNANIIVVLHHIKMILKIILYIYSQSVCSGSKIEKLLYNRIRMMWLSQNQTQNEKGNFYIISIEIAFFTYPRTLCLRRFLCFIPVIYYVPGLTC